MKRVKLLFIIFVAGLLITGLAIAQTGVKKKRPLPHDYGKVVINNYSENAGLAPVEFDHWLHRARFTCRVCHVDIAFAMKAGGTGIKAADNMRGYYCGTCHNGKTEVEGRKVFEACSKNPSKEDFKRCDRCHSYGKNVKKEYDFYKFTERFPKERFGNGIDWEKAEADGLIKPVDFIEGVSIQTSNLKGLRTYSIKERRSKVKKEFLATPYRKGSGLSDFINTHFGILP